MADTTSHTVLVKEATEVIFGPRLEGCPVCSTTGDYVIVDKTHWFYCNKHRTKWRLNLNAFESYRDTDNNPYTKEEKWAVLDAEARDIEDWFRD